MTHKVHLETGLNALSPQHVLHFAVDQRAPFKSCQKQHVLLVVYLVVVCSSLVEFASLAH